MNLRQFSIAFLISALPAVASAGAGISLDKGDFIAAERVARNGATVVSVKLSKSGKAKFKKLNDQSVGQKIHMEIAQLSSDFLLRQPIQGEGLEMGPFSEADAEKVMREINHKK